MNMKKWMTAAVLTALSLVFWGCPSGGSGSDYTPAAKTPPVGTPNGTPDKTPSEDNKTYVEFQSHEVFPARIYKDPSHITLFAEVPAKGSAKVEASPNAMGVAFYPVFLVEVDGIPITQYGPAVTVRVDEKKVNTVNIPALDSIETEFAYVKIENASIYSLSFNQSAYELTPLGTNSAIVMSGESVAYRIEPREAGVYSFMRNASSPIPFPNGIQIFERDIIYSFRYDGSGLTLTGGKPLLPAPQNVVVTAGNGGVTVTWDAPPRAISYNVYYSAGPTPPETPAQSGITGTGATISGLTNNTPYYVWVASVNAGGSTVSGAKSITLTLPAPRNIVLDGVNGSIAATWDAVSIASSYSVYYSASQTRPETPVKSGITGTAAAISGLTIGATYYVWVESVNSGGSTMSGALPVTLFPAWNVATSQEFTDAVASINASSEAKTYLILLTNSISAGDASFTANAEKTIRIKGEGAVRTVTNTGTAALFTVPSGITLSLENNLFLNGNAQAYRVVSVTGGTLVMNAGSRVSNARSNGIYIGNNGRFTMKGGEISANTLSGNGGGVYVDSNCTFTMEGGEISANTVSGSNGGGGVYVSGSGTFTMKGGEISGNTASSSSDGFYSYSYGGGVYVESSGTFTMKGGKISGNTASTSTSSYSYSGSYPYSFSYGGGVYVESSGTFTMEGGEISGNTASSSASSSSYYSSSSAKSYGGGVYVSSSGAFTMEGGEISGNTASSKASSSSDAYGGGVFVDGSNSTFIKRGGGTIDAANSAKYGKVAYVSSGSKQRNTAAGPNVNLDSAKSGSAGGWE